jgi:hypothetical protein
MILYAGINLHDHLLAETMDWDRFHERFNLEGILADLPYSGNDM